MWSAQKTQIANCRSALINLNLSLSLSPFSFFLLFCSKHFLHSQFAIIWPLPGLKGKFTAWKPLVAGQRLYFHANYTRKQKPKNFVSPMVSCIVNSPFFGAHALCLCRLPIDSNLADRYNNKHMYQVQSTRDKDQVWALRCSCGGSCYGNWCMNAL